MALLVIGSVALLKLTSPTVRGTFGTGVVTAPTDSDVVYGWRNVPPHGSPWLDMSRAPRNALGGIDFVCTIRSVDKPSGRWVCVAYTIIHEPDTRIIEPSDPDATRAQPVS